MLTLLTPTGARPLAWSLCERVMHEQTYAGAVRWVIVDDGAQAQTITFERDGWTLDVLRPTPAWAPGQNTQARNLLAGLAAIAPHERVLVIEDDDHYASDYLDECARDFEQGFEIIGESAARYYNLPQRVGRQLKNDRHASLCATGVAGAGLEALRAAASSRETYIDLRLWTVTGALRRNLRVPGAHRVHGIKGLPGREGIGMGHRARLSGVYDPDGRLLTSWIGEAWAQRYLALVPRDAQR